jgi:hypothetical protein
MTVVRVTLSPSGSVATQAIAYFFSLLGDRGLTINSVSVVSGNTVVDLNPSGVDVADVENDVDAITAQMSALGTITRAEAIV